MQDLYETEYNIYNHYTNNNRRPLASVAMHPAEDINDGSLLEEIMRTYHARRVHDIFHINVLEFLELPVDIVQMMFMICDEENSKKNSVVSSLEKEFAEK